MKLYSSGIFVTLLIYLSLVFGGQYRWVSTYRKPYAKFPSIENDLTTVPADPAYENYLEELKKSEDDLNDDLLETYFTRPIKR